MPAQEWLSKYEVNKTDVHPILTECRVIKSPGELEVMRASAQAAAEGHVDVMTHCKPGIMECYLASRMVAQGMANYNVRFRPYGDIVASGINSATLHYVANEKIIGENEFVLCDCGHTVSLFRTKE